MYDGEIYNFHQLRGELEARGRRFTSLGDTEVLLAAFAGRAAVIRCTKPGWREAALVGLVDGVLYVPRCRASAHLLAILDDPVRWGAVDDLDEDWLDWGRLEQMLRGRRGVELVWPFLMFSL